jgi:hypothetical protein
VCLLEKAPLQACQKDPQQGREAASMSEGITMGYVDKMFSTICFSPFWGKYLVCWRIYNMIKGMILRIRPVWYLIMKC